MDPEIFEFENSKLSEEYRNNQKELADMKRKFYEEHPLPEDNPVGTIGLTQTKKYRERKNEWAKIEEQFMKEHPISDADKEIIDREKRRIMIYC